MKKIYYYLLAASLISGATTLNSCDDDENSINEWNMTYVTLQQADYLKPIPTFNLTHEIGEKIEGEFSISVVAAIQKPSNQDIKVGVNTVCNEISADKIQKSAEFMLIKAGNTKSEPITISISDWSDLDSLNDEMNIPLNIKISGIESNSPEVTGSHLYQSITVNIHKSQAKPVKYLIFGEEPKTGTLHTNINDWDFKFMEGVENPSSNTVAGTGPSDVATNGIPFWVTVNFKSPKQITGIKTTHWGGAYAPTKVELFISDNGSKWESIGEVSTSGATQLIAFKKPKRAQYFKYLMIDVPGRVDIKTLHVYMED